MRATSSGRGGSLFPVSMLLLVLLPLLLMPLAAVFVFALKGGPLAFWDAIRAPEAQFALRFSLLIAFAATAVNAVLGTFTAYVLSKHRFWGDRTLGVVVNLPVAIPTVVVGTSLLLLWGPIGLFGRLYRGATENTRSSDWFFSSRSEATAPAARSTPRKAIVIASPYD